MKRKGLDVEPTTSGGTNKQCSVHHSRRQAKRKDSRLCLFCEKPASPSDPLHEAMTKDIGYRIRGCATKLLETLANTEEHTPVFKLSDLVRLYKDRLIQLKLISPSVHSTRLFS